MTAFSIMGYLETIRIIWAGDLEVHSHGHIAFEAQVRELCGDDESKVTKEAQVRRQCPLPILELILAFDVVETNKSSWEIVALGRCNAQHGCCIDIGVHSSHGRGGCGNREDRGSNNTKDCGSERLWS